MTKPDVVYLALLAASLSLDAFVGWPAFLRRTRDNPARARVWLWWTGIALLWWLAAGAFAVWRLEQRPWSTLRVAPPHGWRIVGTIGLLVAVALAHVPTAAKIVRARRAGRRLRVPDDVRRRVPHTRAELVWFLGLATSAGICEEFVFRGYLIWVAQPFLGLWGAAAASLVVFAAAHAYQGAKGVAAVAATGGLLTAIVLTFGSLIPAMAVHLLIDALAGWLMWFALRDVPAAALVTPASLADYPVGSEAVVTRR